MGDQRCSSYARMALRRWRRPARGFRLSPGRLSVRRLRAKLWTLLGHLGRYVRSVRLLTRGLVVAGGSSSPPAAAAGGRRSPAIGGKGGRQAAPAAGSGSGKAPQRPPCMRSNSFYARAVAECLEFIKGSNAAPPPASPLAHGTPRRGVRC
ncbi:hypothetical protein ACP70R_049338 [Stipagrostis hirtigluma subsp. patula]